eukprot:COSAG05_NODE_300_length_11883_cov_12.913357_16_plen_238_part_00
MCQLTLIANAPQIQIQVSRLPKQQSSPVPRSFSIRDQRLPLCFFFSSQQCISIIQQALAPSSKRTTPMTWNRAGCGRRSLVPLALVAMWAGGGERTGPRAAVRAYPGDEVSDPPPAPEQYPLKFVVKTALAPTRTADDAVIEVVPGGEPVGYYFTAVAGEEELRSNLALNSHALLHEREHGPKSEWGAIDAALKEAQAAEAEIVEVIESPTHTQRRNRRYVWKILGEDHAGRSVGPV